MSKTATILGATGSQDMGAVVAELLKDPQWKVRAVTRNITGSKAKALESQGAKVVYADLDLPRTLVEAIKRSHAVFGITDPWQYMEEHGNRESQDIETKQGMDLVDALASLPTLEHFIWSTLPPASAGGVEVPHFNAKAEVGRYIKTKYPDLAAKTTFLFVTWYAENIARFPFLKPVKIENSGQYIFIQPCSPQVLIPMAGRVSTNTGLFARAILSRPDVSSPANKVRVEIDIEV